MLILLLFERKLEYLEKGTNTWREHENQPERSDSLRGISSTNCPAPVIFSNLYLHKCDQNISHVNKANSKSIDILNWFHLSSSMHFKMLKLCIFQFALRSQLSLTNKKDGQSLKNSNKTPLGIYRLHRFAVMKTCPKREILISQGILQLKGPWRRDKPPNNLYLRKYKLFLRHS